ncbi:MAG: hypothetical protein PUB20_03610 [Clostridia bacterium]|nr:hypothetical protein [Clostridia bacterium]
MKTEIKNKSNAYSGICRIPIKKHKLLGILSLAAAAVYVFAYSFIPFNPEYGNHASTFSNVGRDHRILFAVWGFLVCMALLVNIDYLVRKYSVKTKFPNIMGIIGSVGALGFVVFKNEKHQKFRVSFDSEIYSGDYFGGPENFESSDGIFSFIFSLKTLHTISVVIFGLCFAFSLLYCLISLAARSKKFVALTVGFGVFMILAAVTFAFKLSGLSEAIAVDLVFILFFCMNYITAFDDKSILSDEYKKINKK